MTAKARIVVDRDELHRLYVAEGKTSREIAKQVGCSFRTILRKLHKYGLEVRNPGAPLVERLQDADWLRQQYVERGLSTVQIALGLGAKPRTVNSWLTRHKIQTRPSGNAKGLVISADVRQKMSEARRGKYQGASNPNWKGGLISDNTRLRNSYESKRWSLLVRAKDGNACAECGKTGKLHAHHVKHWKKYPELRFDVGNGVTLCPVCHQKAHGFKFPDWAIHDENPRAPDSVKLEI